MPFDLSTVADLRLPGRLALMEFNTPDDIRFRVKATSVAEAADGQLLAVGDRIRPAWAAGRQKSLFPVGLASLDQNVLTSGTGTQSNRDGITTRSTSILQPIVLIGVPLL